MRQVEEIIFPLVESHFPDFYRDEGSRFISFVKEYYRWMQSEGEAIHASRNLLDYRSIDTTSADFIKYFTNKYLIGIPLNSQANVQFLIKHASDIYKSKGTERGVQLLIQGLFDEEARVVFPGESIFKASDGTWTKPQYLELTISSRTSGFVGKEIIGSRSGAKAFLESLVTRRIAGKYQQVAYLSNVRGTFDTGELITTTNETFFENAPTIIGSMTTLTVIDGGAEFFVGDIFDVSSSNGKQGKARVTEVSNETGKVTFIYIDALTSGGWGYSLDHANVIVSQKVLTLTNITNANGFVNTFSRFENVTQPLINIAYTTARGNNQYFDSGSVIENYAANGTIIANATIAVSSKTTSNAGYIIVVPNVGNIVSQDTTFAVRSDDPDVSSFNASLIGYAFNVYTAGYTNIFTGGYTGSFTVGYTSPYTSSFTRAFGSTFTAVYGDPYTKEWTSVYASNLFTGAYSTVFSSSYNRNFSAIFSATGTSSFTGSYIGSFTTTLNTFSPAYTQTFSGVYTSNGFTGVYSQTFTGNYAISFTASFTGSTVPGPFVGTYAGNYSGEYAGYFTGSRLSPFNGLSYVSAYVGYFAGVYVGNYQGTYPSNYVNPYTGESYGVFTGEFAVQQYQGTTFSQTFTGSYTKTNIYTSGIDFYQSLGFTGNFLDTFTREFTGTFTSSYTNQFTGSFNVGLIYTGNFTNVYSSSFTGTYSNVFTNVFGEAFTGVYNSSFSQVFSGTYSNIFTKAYTGLFNVFSGSYNNLFTQAFNVTYSRTFTGSGGFTRAFTPTFTDNFNQAFSGTYSTTFTGVFTKQFTGSYTTSFSGLYTGAFAPTFSGTFSGSYTGAFAPTFSGTYNSFTGAYTFDVYTKGYLGTYTGTFSGGYTSTFSGGFTATFSGTYGGFTGNYTLSYTGLYTSGGNRINTLEAHSFSNNDLVRYHVRTGNTAVSELSTGAAYYVVNTVQGSTLLHLSHTPDGAAISITRGSDQTGHDLIRTLGTAVIISYQDRTATGNVIGSNVSYTSFSFNAQTAVSNTNDTITIPNHTFENNYVISYVVSTGNTAIDGLVNRRSYYVVNTTASTFKLATTKSGTPLNISSGNEYQEGHTFVHTTGFLGVVDIGGNNFVSSPHSIIFGSSSNTYASVANVSTGTGADFKIGLLTDTENVLLSPDFIEGQNSSNVIFANIKLNGIGSNVVAGGYGIGNTFNANSDVTAGTGGTNVLLPSSVQFNALSGVSNTNDIITLSNKHVFSNGEQVKYLVTPGNTAIGGLANNVNYFVVNTTPGSTSLQLSLTSNGAVINVTASSNETGHSLTRQGTTSSNNTIALVHAVNYIPNSAVHYFTNSGNTAISGLVSNTVYYIDQSNATHVTLKANTSGTRIELEKGLTQTGHNLFGPLRIITGANSTYGNVGYDIPIYRGLGFLKFPGTNLDTILLDALRFDSTTIGSIASVVGVNPGVDYNVDPFVTVIDTYVSGYNRRDYVMAISNTVGSFIDGEQIQQSYSNAATQLTISNFSGTAANGISSSTFVLNEFVYQSNSTTNVAASGFILEAAVSSGSGTLKVLGSTGTFTATTNTLTQLKGLSSGSTSNISSIATVTVATTARALVKSANSTVLKLKRINLENTFLLDNVIIGRTSGATANVVSIVEDANTVPVGLNAYIEANVQTANNVVKKLSVADSGFGYLDQETVTLTKSGSVFSVTAIVELGQQGVGSGYYSTTRGFLSDDRKLQDNEYYQEYSYEVQTKVPFDKYFDVLKQITHVAGTKAFGRVNTLSFANMAMTAINSIETSNT